MNINDILKEAQDKGASDIHFISGLQPMLRINRDLIPATDSEPLTKDEMWDIYDFFLSGNVEKDKLFRETKVLDTSAKFGDLRLRVNISYSEAVPVITTRLIKILYQDMRI